MISQRIVPFRGILSKGIVIPGRSVSRTLPPLGVLSKLIRITRPVCKPRSVQKAGIPEGTTLPWMSISLGDTLLHRSCSLPGTQMRRAASCPCLTLLRMGVAWPPALLPAPVVSYTTFSPFLFFTLSLEERVGVRCSFCGPTNSFALRLAIPDVIRHPALWSADFPRPPEGDRAHPTSLVNSSYYYG